MSQQHSEHAAVLHLAANRAIDFLASLDARPVTVSVDADALRARLGGTLPSCGTPAIAVIAGLLRDVEPALLGSAGGRFFAWVIGGTLPSALAADWLTSVAKGTPRNSGIVELRVCHRVSNGTRHVSRCGAPRALGARGLGCRGARTARCAEDPHPLECESPRFDRPCAALARHRHG
jgi:hypothetical protein